MLSQTYDHITKVNGEDLDEVQESEKRKPEMRVVGVPGDKLPGNDLPAQALSTKALGHALSIMFWNSGQSSILRALRGGVSGLLLADYGCGKTSLTMAGALAAAEDPAYKVYFISAANWASQRGGPDDNDIIMDIAFKVKFRGTGVEVVTANQLFAMVSVS